MIVGIGTDIVEISRFENINAHFVNRIYTQNEIDLLNGKPHRLAGNFSAKEAVSKVLGTGFAYGVQPVYIEIVRDKTGKPVCNLYESAKLRAEEMGIDMIHISISHCKSYAAAMAVAERK